MMQSRFNVAVAFYYLIVASAGYCQDRSPSDTKLKELEELELAIDVGVQDWARRIECTATVECYSGRAELVNQKYETSYKQKKLELSGTLSCADGCIRTRLLKDHDPSATNEFRPSDVTITASHALVYLPRFLRKNNKEHVATISVAQLPITPQKVRDFSGFRRCANPLLIAAGAFGAISHHGCFLSDNTYEAIGHPSKYKQLEVRRFGKRIGQSIQLQQTVGLENDVTLQRTLTFDISRGNPILTKIAYQELPQGAEFYCTFLKRQKVGNDVIPTKLILARRMPKKDDWSKFEYRIFEFSITNIVTGKPTDDRFSFTVPGHAFVTDVQQSVLEREKTIDLRRLQMLFPQREKQLSIPLYEQQSVKRTTYEIVESGDKDVIPKKRSNLLIVYLGIAAVGITLIVFARVFWRSRVTDELDERSLVKN